MTAKSEYKRLFTERYDRGAISPAVCVIAGSEGEPGLADVMVRLERAGLATFVRNRRLQLNSNVAEYALFRLKPLHETRIKLEE